MVMSQRQSININHQYFFLYQQVVSGYVFFAFLSNYLVRVYQQGRDISFHVRSALPLWKCLSLKRSNTDLFRKFNLPDTSLSHLLVLGDTCH